MKRVLPLRRALSYLLCLSILGGALGAVNISAAEEDTDFYPAANVTADESYREIVSKNDMDSTSEVKDYIQDAEVISVADSVTTYSTKSEDNRIYFYPTPAVSTEKAKKIELRMRIPVEISEIIIYFSHGGTDWAEERTYHITDVQPSDEFQSFYITTASNSEWTGSVDQYGITVKGGVGAAYAIDYVKFYGDYKKPYTENEQYRIYEFDTPNYGFECNEYITDPVLYDDELWIKTDGGDAALTTSEGSFEADAEKIPQIKLSYNNQTTGTQGRLYFATESAPGYSDERCYVFELYEGQAEYIIDTCENKQWKGMITGLRFVPSDEGGIVRIGSIRLEKFNCAVSVSDGKIHIYGDLYGKTGRMTVQAQNNETGEIDYKGNIRTNLKGEFDTSFAITNPMPKPVIYDLIFESNVLTGVFKKRIIYISADYAEETLNKINEARESEDTALVKSLIEENYEPLYIKAKFYEMCAAEDSHMDELYAELLGKTSEDLNGLENDLNEAAVTVSVRYMSADEWLNAVDEYDEYLKLKELPAYVTYSDAGDSIKLEIAGKMSAEKCRDIAAAQKAFEKNVVLTAIAHAVAWGDVKNVLETNAVLLGIDFSAVNKLKAPSDVYRQMTEKAYTTLDAVKTAFDDAVSAQAKKELASSGGSGGSSGGGGGGSSGGGFGVYTPSSANSSGNIKPTAAPEPTAVPEVTETPQTSESEVLFDDLDGFCWAKPYIKKLCEKGVVSGTGDKKFEPARQVNREEFVKMLVLALELPLSQYTDFEDVGAGAWYADYIGAAVNAKLIYGQDGMFGVGKPMTRQDVAVTAARALGIDSDAEKTDFTDSADIADYAVAAVDVLTKQGIIEGYDDGSFGPMNCLTRAEAAVIINRVIERIGK